jgi:hypothetical protein
MFGFNFDIDDNETFQEASYDAASSSYKDLFEDKFTSFNPENIVTSGNNKLRTDMFDMEIENSDLAIGYKNDPPATDPKIGRWMD